MTAALDWVTEWLALLMFVAMVAVVFLGYPVAFVLGGVALIFAAIGWVLDVFNPLQLFNLAPRVWGGIAADPVLVSVPLFIYMGTVLERSGIAEDLLHCLQVLLNRVPGGLAIAVMVMGTILAAPIGVVGASVVLLSLIALPAMLGRGYDQRLSIGTIASAGTLGILIPPSVMLVVMGEQLQQSVGALFAAATMPGFLLAGLYTLYIAGVCALRPSLAPREAAGALPQGWQAYAVLLLKGFVPSTILIVFVLASILLGWATPTESAAVGCFGTLVLALANRSLTRPVFRETLMAAASTNGMVFLILIGATVFSYVFRALGGDDLILDVLKGFGVDTAWEMLAFVMALIFLLGFCFEWIEICLIVLPIFGPILAGYDFSAHLGGRQADFMPWFAALVAVNLQTSFMSPPFGGTLFYLRGTVPPEISIGTIYRSMTPFLILQVIGLAVCIAFPEVVLWLPRATGYLD